MTSKLARVALTTSNGKNFQHQFDESTTLNAMLAYFEEQENILEANHKSKVESGSEATDFVRTRFLAYEGVPEVEGLGPKSNGQSIVQVHINVKGTMHPKLDLGNKRYDHSSDFDRLTLKDIGITAKTPTRVRLSHVYVKPAMTAEQEREALENLKRQLGVPTSSSSSSATKDGLYKRSATSATEQVSKLREAETTSIDVGLNNSRKVLVEVFRRSNKNDVARSEEVEKTSAEQEKKHHKENEKDEKEEEEEVIEVSTQYSPPPVPTHEVDDSDDDAFYEINEEDLKVMASIYQRHEGSMGLTPLQQGSTKAAKTKTKTKVKTEALQPQKVCLKFRLPSITAGEVNTHTNTNMDDNDTTEAQTTVNQVRVLSQVVIEGTFRSTDTVGDIYEFMHATFRGEVTAQLNTQSQSQSRDNKNGANGTIDKGDVGTGSIDPNTNAVFTYTHNLTKIMNAPNPYSLSKYPFNLAVTHPYQRLLQKSMMLRDLFKHEKNNTINSVVNLEWIHKPDFGKMFGELMDATTDTDALVNHHFTVVSNIIDPSVVITKKEHSN